MISLLLLFLTSLAIMSLMLYLILRYRRLNCELMRKLEKAKMETNALLYNLPFAGYIKDSEGNFLTCNSKFEELVGFPLSNPQGIKIYKIIDSQCFNVKESHEADAAVFEKQLQTSGGKVWFEIHKKILKDSKRNIIGTAVALRDISAAKEIEKQKESFVSTLTHDLKTPTISQIKALQLLTDGALGDLSDTQNELIANVLQSCNYMYTMISTLLTVYKYENEEFDLNTERFDFIQLLNDCINELEHLAVEKSQIVVKKINIEELTINADRQEIKRVIINILSNAISYSYKNSQVQVFTEHESDSLKFYVVNNGKILSSEDISQLFQKYTSDAKKFRLVGTGLGLFISKKIISAHKGSMIVSSEAGKGNTFGFEIPLSYKNAGTENKEMIV